MPLWAVALMLAGADKTTVGPKPIGNPEGWITSDDYPSEALRSEQGGVVEFEVTINESGHAARCRILRSSGSALLDGTACAAIARRGSWELTRDKSGNAIFAVYRRRVIWRLYGDKKAKPPPIEDMEIEVAKLPIPAEEAVVVVRQIQRVDGSEESCIVADPSPSDVLNQVACRMAAPLSKLDPIANENGDLVRGARWRVIRFVEQKMAAVGE